MFGIRSSFRAALCGALAIFVFAGCEQQPDGSVGLAHQALVQADVCADAADPACLPSGAHAKHGGFACSVCHKVAGRLAFDKSGPAYAADLAAPSFDAVAKTCTNIACHRVPAGTFSYNVIDGNGEPVLTTVTYGGAPPPSPSWNSTGATCNVCHGSRPQDGYTWHSGFHGGQGPTGARNQCQFCHPDATSTNAVGTAITNPSLHRNGVLNVQATFTSSCFGCH